MATPKAVDNAQMSSIREVFPALHQSVNGNPLVYLDNAATAQKPQSVIDSINEFYSTDNANIHRGVHVLSQRATEAYEDARARIAAFLGAADHREVVFTRGATEAVNLVASCLVGNRLNRGDTVLISEMEHHANIVPWQILRDRHGIQLATIAVTDEGILDQEDFKRKLLELRPKLLSVVHVSNSLGTINPVRDMIEMAHAENIPVLLDASQSVPHFPVNVQDLDCDWLVFSGHKLFGPTGIGVLYGKLACLEAMPPYQGGGDMIESVSFDKTVYKSPPERFEAGTPHIAGVIGLAAAVDFLEKQDRQALHRHEQALLEAATEGLSRIPGLRIIGLSDNKASVISFLLDVAHPHDIASFLDADGVAIRSGHHCTQPLMHRFGIPGTARASFTFYNTFEEVEILVRGVEKIRKFFS